MTITIHYLKTAMSCHAVTLASFNIFLSAIITPTESLALARAPTVDVQASLQLRLIVHSKSPQTSNKFGAVPLEVWVVKMVMRPTGVLVVFNSRLCFPEAVQVELTDKT